MERNKPPFFADLHVHTDFSDSTLSPAQVVEYASQAGLKAVAITDHDVVDGIPAVASIARLQGLEVIAGVELTAEMEGEEIHILGYFIDYSQPWFLNKLNKICRVRRERIYLIVEKLNKVGVRVNADDIFACAGRGSVGRMHVGQVIVKAGYASDLKDAFEKYIGNKAVAYVKKYTLSPAEAISMISRIGGIPVLAHPYLMGRDEFIPYYVENGLMGIEVFHTSHSDEAVVHYKNIAQKYGLVTTGGSDCHGLAKGEVLIGRVKVDYQIVEQLKSLKKKIS